MKKFLLTLVCVLLAVAANAQSAAGTYKLVTSANELLEEGAEFLVVDTKDNLAMGAANSNGNNRASVGVTITNNEITISTQAVSPVRIIASSNSSYPYQLVVSTANGDRVLGNATTSNYLKEYEMTKTDAGLYCNISINSTATTISFNKQNKNKDFTLQKNTSGTMFATYVSSQTPVVLFKKVVENNKTDIELAWSESEVTLVQGETFTAPTLTRGAGFENVAVEYNSQNVNVATIDATTGVVTLTGNTGKTVITASVPESDETYKGSAFYTLTVKKANVAGQWVLVTSTDQLKEGAKYIIVANEKNVAMSTTFTTSFFGKVDNIEIAADNTIAELPEGTNELTLSNLNVTADKTTADFQAYFGEEQKYMVATGEKKIGSADSKPTTSWTIKIGNDGTTSLYWNSSYGTLYYNASSPRFTTYTSNQTKTQLYVFEETTTPAAPEAPVASTEEGVVNGVIDLDNYTNGVEITLTVAEGCSLYYKFEASDAPQALIDAEAEGYTKAEGTSIKVNVDKAGTLSYFSEKDGQQSAVQTISFRGATTAISEIEAAEGEAVYYDLMGRKVANPEKGLYIRVINGKAVKVVL